jgi:hypothetical protein
MPLLFREIQTNPYFLQNPRMRVTTEGHREFQLLIMIDKSKINGQELIETLLDTVCGNYNKWWELVEFEENYMPKFPHKDSKPTKISIKCGESYLRDLGHGCFIWDMHYGKDSEFFTHENALLCLMKAPVPPFLLKPIVWGKL